MENAKNQIFTANSQIKMMIEAHLKKFPNLSLNGIAKKTGIPGTTLRRLMADESKVELAPHLILALISFLLKEKRMGVLLRKLEGPVAELLKNSFGHFVFEEERDDYQMDLELNKMLKDKMAYMIYKMAANKKGITIAEVKNNFGLMGLKKLDELHLKQWLEVDSNEVFHAKQMNFSVDLKTALDFSHALIDQFKLDDLDKGWNLFYSLSESLTDEGISMIKKIEYEAVKNIHQIMNDARYHGSKHYFSLLMSDIIGVTEC